jgi:ubiquitin-protein ligase
MDSKVQQLVEMGIAEGQARAALRKYKDVMDAAEKIFSGEFEGDDDVVMADGDGEGRSTSEPKRSVHMATPPMRIEDKEDDDNGSNDDVLDDDDDDGAEEFQYYDDSDDDELMKAPKTDGDSHADPYAGIFFSKDRREEVIEVEEQPESAVIDGVTVPLMTQGKWMKGCPEGGEQGFLFQLYTELATESCPCPEKCGYSFQREKKMFFPIFKEFGTYIDKLQSFVVHTCGKCQKQFCLACGESVNKESRGPTSPPYDALFHCSNLQGVILGIGLAMLEHAYQHQDQIPGVNTATSNTKKRKVDASDPSAMYDDDDIPVPGAPAGKRAKGGIGYAGNAKEDHSGQIQAQAIQKQKDEKIGNLLKEVRVYLPNLHRPGGGQTSDYLVHPTALAHLRRRFNFVSSSLLRNDSLTDMSDRSVLYFELFEWLETISNHETLASMMAMPIMVPHTTTDLKGSRRTGTIERKIIYEGSSGPRELLEAIVIQAQAAVKGLKSSEQPESDQMTEEEKRALAGDEKGKGKEIVPMSDENLKLLTFCERIISTAKAIDRSLRETKGATFVDRLHASLPKIPSTTSSEPGPAVQLTEDASEEETKRTYLEWATRVRFEYCDLSIPTPPPKRTDTTTNTTDTTTTTPTPGYVSMNAQVNPADSMAAVPNYKHYFNNEARMLANSDIPKRSLAIAKELAVLTTNLPISWDSSVFLRVDETRVDIIKCLITGPQGTPYDNGCYLFDIFLGPTYNQSAPSVKYMTTNGGKFRFNPNLYADGKVCLSLLGTWSGPGWVPGKSTLLQVLISIQSMILCDEPYLNEPGWAGHGGTPQSMAYSANVRRMVVHTAMLGNLKNPPEPFSDIIRTHFRLKAKSLYKQLDEWLDRDDGQATHGQGAQYTGAKLKNTSGGQGSGNGFRETVEELKGLLRRLEKGEDIDAPAAKDGAGSSTGGATTKEALTVVDDGDE